jgi:hypothetical protein
LVQAQVGTELSRKDYAYDLSIKNAHIRQTLSPPLSVLTQRLATSNARNVRSQFLDPKRLGIPTISQGDQLCDTAQQSFHQSRERLKEGRLARQINAKNAQE